jgi:hypothetical protein
MHPFVLDPASLPPVADLLGAVVTEEVRAGGRNLFRKGHRLSEADLVSLPTLDRSIHAVRLEMDDVHEDFAGRRLAESVAGAGSGGRSSCGDRPRAATTSLPRPRDFSESTESDCGRST